MTTMNPTSTILLIDDTDANRYVLARILRSAGYEVCEGLTGKEALVLAETQPALIILDVGLPDVDGREVCRALKDNPVTSLIPIIQMSAKFTEDKYMIEALAGGADGYLIQPVDPPVLIATVRALVRLSRSERERVELFNKERIARQEAEAERGKLQEAVRVRDEFLSIASHELKTPLTTLKMQNQIRKRGLLRGDRTILDMKEMLKLLDRDGRQISRLARLVDDMLDTAIISAGRLNLSYEKTDLSEMVQETVDRFQSEFETVGCSIVLDLEAAITGDCDPFRIEQVLVNLFSNAVKYAAGKPVYISLKQGPRLEEDSRHNLPAGQPQVILTVRDEGIGIASEFQKRIFSRFERAISSSEISGLGLGLYILEQIVHAHRGTVQLESEPAKGSTFTVTLPLTRPTL
jgi:signal transduction histidine kinase